MRFIVTMQRIESRQHDFEIEAENAAEARGFAMREESVDFDWRNATVYHAEESVESIIEGC